MTMIRYRYADFCNISGEITTTNKHYWLCVKHGEVTIVPYYGYALAIVLWACPKCIEEHLNGAIVAAKEETKQVCWMCVSTAGLVECETCGQYACVNHRRRMICDNCVEDAEATGFGFYHG